MISRRRFLKTSALACGFAAVPAAGWSRAVHAEPDVLIIGAGLSGLHAALLLEAEGATVRMLEGRNRIGGRVHTLDDVPGAPEAGGNGVGAMYARMISRANDLGVELRPIRRRTENTADTTIIARRGRLIAAADWAADRANPLPDGWRDTPPWQVAFRYGAETNPLSSIGAWREPDASRYDTSLAAHMMDRGFSAEAVDLAGTNYSFASDAWRASTLSLYQSVAWFEHQLADPRAFAIAGGNQRLPEAMAAAVRGDIITGARVIAVRADGANVEAICADGTRHRARRMIVTSPPQVLSQIAFDPGLNAARAEASRMLEALPVFQVHFAVEDAFWDRDGLPSDLWSDSLCGRVMTLRYDDADPDRVTSLVAFIGGHGAAMLAALPEADAITLVSEDLARVRPSTRGALRPLRTVSWQSGGFSGGAYTAWRPGQIERHVDAFQPRPGDPILFAGTHNAVLENGMEGAFEAGEAAAFEILV